MCDIVEKLWQKIYEYGLFVRKNDMDGLDAWNKIKVILQKYNKDCEWLPEATNRYSEMKAKFNIVDEDNDSSWSADKKQLWEETHFFFQHSRIPYNSRTSGANLLRLMQIAYNAGQYEAEKEKNSYDKEKINYYVNNHLESYISYVTPHSVRKMCIELSSEHPALREIADVHDEISAASESKSESKSESSSDAKMTGGDLISFKTKCMKYYNKIKRLNNHK